MVGAPGFALFRPTPKPCTVVHKIDCFLKKDLAYKDMPDTSPDSTAGLLRRLAAMTYDGLLVAAVVFLSAVPVVVALGGPPESALAKSLFRLYLAAVMFVFFAGFWMRGGQTLGMRSWRLRLVRMDGGPVGWLEALKRYLAAWLSLVPLGMGWWWMLLDRDKLAWHDRLSGTRLIVLPKSPRAGKAPVSGDAAHEPDRE